jgi:hypothetical protein
MALPSSLLIAVERLRQDENALLRRYSVLHAPTVDTVVIDAAVQQVVLDRIRFAKEFITSARDMLAGTPSTMDFRNTTSRAYYAVHHTLRAVLLYDLKADTYGHVESINDFVKRMNHMPALKAKADAAGITKDALLAILHRRHLADYHYYGSAEPFEEPVDFSVIGPEAARFAETAVGKMEEYLKDRIAGRY